MINIETVKAIVKPIKHSNFVDDMKAGIGKTYNFKPDKIIGRGYRNLKNNYFYEESWLDFQTEILEGDEIEVLEDFKNDCFYRTKGCILLYNHVWTEDYKSFLYANLDKIKFINRKSWNRKEEEIQGIKLSTLIWDEVVNEHINKGDKMLSDRVIRNFKPIEAEDANLIEKHIMPQINMFVVDWMIKNNPELHKYLLEKAKELEAKEQKEKESK